MTIEIDPAVLEAMLLSRIDAEPQARLSPRGVVAILRALDRNGYQIVKKAEPA